MTVFTIGYQGLDIDTFLSLLAEHGIETVVDIRELPCRASLASQRRRWLVR